MVGMREEGDTSVVGMREEVDTIVAVSLYTSDAADE